MNKTKIDLAFDFRTDATGPDPDNSSPTLRRYHQLLWTKYLPTGKFFDLDTNWPNRYLYHKSELGEFVLTSDAVIQTFQEWRRFKHIRSQLPNPEIAYFHYIGYTIGGMMVFPGNKINGGMTINGARGFNQKIGDRFDLTLECIRRHYNGGEGPLHTDLARYHEFFSLFIDFKGYVDFFLLQDLVVDDYSAVRFFTPFDNFNSSPLPESIEAYRLFRERTIAFVESRNARIANLYP